MFGLRGLAAVLNEHFLLLRAATAPRSRGSKACSARSTGATGCSRRWSRPSCTGWSVFRGDFTLEAAIEVAAGDGISLEQIYAGMLTLSAKSLVTTDVSAETPQHHHRLLHVTRAFVAHRLGESPERGRVVRRHAEYLCRLLGQAEADWEAMERRQWLAMYARVIDDVRAALDWAFSPDGDAAIGVALTAWSLPLGYQLSLIDELRVWVERALLHAGSIAPAQPLPEMRLNIAMIRLSQNLTVPVPVGHRASTARWNFPGSWMIPHSRSNR